MNERYTCPSGCAIGIDAMTTTGYCLQCGEELRVHSTSVPSETWSESKEWTKDQVRDAMREAYANGLI